LWQCDDRRYESESEVPAGLLPRLTAAS
jgi:hypothetical protein